MEIGKYRELFLKIISSTATGKLMAEVTLGWNAVAT